MNTHTAYDGFGLRTLRVALHLGQPAAARGATGPVASVARTDWLERLAIWAERQPAFHRMGSYTQR